MSWKGWELTAVHRNVSVKGSGGVSATVLVTVRQGKVWVSIMPPFTWEAIMEPRKVDELIGTLARLRKTQSGWLTGSVSQVEAEP